MTWETRDTLATRIRSYSGSHEEFVSWVMELAGPLQDKSVLEVGCGTGTFLAEADKRGARKIFGLDVNPHMVEASRKACPKAILSCQHMDDPWPIDEPVSLLFAVYSAYYSEDVGRLIQRAWDALVPGGTVVVVGPSPNQSWEVREHRSRGLPMTELRGTDKAMEIVSALVNTFGKATITRRVNRLTFQDSAGFMDYYRSTALLRQLDPKDQERANRVMTDAAEGVLAQSNQLTIDKEVWGLVAQKA